MEDNKLLRLLHKDPNAGMEQLMNQYTGLVYAVVKSKLADSYYVSSDIEDCVADVFSKFYAELSDYAVNTCDIPGDQFIKLFLASSVCQRMENGEPAYLAGKSGIEIAAEVVYETMGKELTQEPAEKFGRSGEYWIGWAVAYYQWYSGRKFSEIFRAVTYTDLQQMYHTLHEADISKFVDIVDERIRLVYPDTNLKRIRTAYGCTQAELAKSSGVSLRSIQMYEQRGKDINKASVETVYRLAKALGCAMEDLIER